MLRLGSTSMSLPLGIGIRCMESSAPNSVVIDIKLNRPRCCLCRDGNSWQAEFRCCSPRAYLASVSNETPRPSYPCCSPPPCRFISVLLPKSSPLLSNPTRLTTLTMVLCRYYQKADCTKGDTCRYNHDVDTATTLPTTTAALEIRSASTVSTAQQHVSPAILCRFFRSGKCTRGSSCTFAHTPASHLPSETARPRAHVLHAQDSRSQVPCRFYVRGQCTNGSTCPYSHSGEVVPPSKLEAQDEYGGR